MCRGWTRRYLPVRHDTLRRHQKRLWKIGRRRAYGDGRAGNDVRAIRSRAAVLGLQELVAAGSKMLASEQEVNKAPETSDMDPRS